MDEKEPLINLDDQEIKSLDNYDNVMGFFSILLKVDQRVHPEKYNGSNHD